jgi:hypothetical protein
VDDELLFKAQSAPVVVELIRNKANVNVKDFETQKTPLEMAIDAKKSQSLIRAFSNAVEKSSTVCAPADEPSRSTASHTPFARSNSLAVRQYISRSNSMTDGGGSGVATPIVASTTSSSPGLSEMSPSDIVQQLESIHQYVTSHHDDLADKAADTIWTKKCSDLARGIMGALAEIEKRQQARIGATLCTICKMEQKSVVLMPCRHFCVCGSCAKALQNGGSWEPADAPGRTTNSQPCPICRSDIHEFVSVYT